MMLNDFGLTLRYSILTFIIRTLTLRSVLTFIVSKSFRSGYTDEFDPDEKSVRVKFRQYKLRK